MTILGTYARLVALAIEQKNVASDHFSLRTNATCFSQHLVLIAGH